MPNNSQPSLFDKINVTFSDDGQYKIIDKNFILDFRICINNSPVESLITEPCGSWIISSVEKWQMSHLITCLIFLIEFS